MAWCRSGWVLAWLTLAALACVASPQEAPSAERGSVGRFNGRHQGRRHDPQSRPATSTRRTWWGDSTSAQSAAGVTPWDRANARENLGQTSSFVRRREEDGARHHSRQGSGHARQPAFRHSPLTQEAPTGTHHRLRDGQGDSVRTPPLPASSDEVPSGRSRAGQGVPPRSHSSSRWQPYQKNPQTPFGSENTWRRLHTAHRPPRLPRRDKRPNIVLILTDDQDVELGSLNYMPQLMSLMKDGGAYFPQAYTTTPMCCPSRSSILTGMYIHNHEVYTNNENCSSPMWQQTHERRTFATYLNDAGYRTGYFGKYLNKYNGSHVPVGWREWSGLLMNSRYYNYTVNRNNHWVKYGDQYPRDYYPHVITSDGLHFLKTSKRLDPSPPVMMVLSYPAPHGPEDSAPEHAHKYFNASDHHTVSYNYAPNPDKQWILQFTSRMHDIQLKFTDVLMTKRLQTLQTVDEAVHRIIRALDSLGELDNTYIFYTSDHGYHLGQFGLVKGKSMPFEFDIKVPFLVRGPGIKAGVQINKIALNVDLAPTFLDIAGIKPPPHMDGRSLLPLLKSDQPDYVTWRDSFLVESSGRHREEDALELRKMRRLQRARGMEASASTEGGLYTSKHERLDVVCQNEEYRAPCGPLQKWECVRDRHRWRLQKCRKKNTMRRRKCVCEPDLGMGYLVKLDSVERRKQRLFLKKHVTQDLKSYEPKFIKAFSDVDSGEVAEQSLGRRIQRNSKWARNRKRRFRRSSDSSPISDESKYNNGEDNEDDVDDFVSEEEMRAIDDQIHHLSDELESLESVSSTTSSSDSVRNESLSTLPSSYEDTVKLRHGCRATGTSVDCTDEVYRDPHAWKVSKEAIDDQIRRLRDQLFIMKDIRKHLRDKRPDSVLVPEDYEYSEDDDHPIAENYDIDVNSILGLDDGVDIPDTTFEENDYLEEEDNIIVDDDTEEEETHTHSYMEDNLEDTTVMAEMDVNVEDGDEYVTTELPDDKEEEVHLVAIGENITTTVTATESTIVDDDEIIIGIDYSDYNPRDYRKKIKNRLNGRRKQKGRKSKFDIFHDTPGDGHHDRTRQKNKNQDPTLDENQTVMEHRGQDVLDSSSEASSQFHLYPSRGATKVNSVPSTIDNETASRPICWCDRRMATKIAIQQERARKRAERQQLKLERMKKRERKQKKKTKHNLAECNFAQLNCYTHDNDHWRTPPLWHGGKFCFCMNAANNTYWCLRTINDTHNFLFCEFITGLVTYYDLNIDPYQLRNVAFTLSDVRLAELHHRLEKLRTCSGADSCDDIPGSHAHKNNFQITPRFEQRDDQSLMNDIVGPPKKLSKAERLLERKERRRLRKAQKKLKRKYSGNQLYVPGNQHVLDSIGSRKHKVRLPRKSRLEKEQRRMKRRERRRRKKSRKERVLSSG